jgi:hypothetical protein
VGLTIFEALDKAIEAGGTALASKDIVGSAKGANVLVDEMCSSGLLEKTAAKSPKYTVTAKGRETWERDASEDRRLQLQQREQVQRHQALAEFLAVVAKKQGKALTKSELPRFPDAVRQEACDRKLVGAGDKESSYCLLADGEEFLLTQRPVEQQLEELRHLHREMTTKLRAVHGRLGQELDGSGGQALQAAAEHLAQRGADAIRAFDSALAALGSLAGIADAVRQVRTEIESASRQAHQVVIAERSRLAEIEARLREETSRQQEQLESFERRTEARLADIARKLESAGSSVVKPPAERGGTPPEAVVWQAVRASHERLRQENLRIGGIVKVPDLTDAVLRTVEGISATALHELLKKWQQEDKLTLQLCNDPRLEPRAAEGINSPRGLLFYIQMR